MNNVIRLLKNLGPKRKRKLVVITFCSLLVSFLDVFSIASVFPLVSVVVNPEKLIEDPAYNFVFLASGIDDKSHFVLVLGIAVFSLIFVATILRALTNFAQIRFVLGLEAFFGKLLVSKYLHRDYSWYVRKNNSEIFTTILTEVGVATVQGVMPLLFAFNGLLLLLAIFSAMFFVNPLLSISALSFLAIFYLLIFRRLTKNLSSAGKKRVKVNNERLATLSAAFDSLKEIKITKLHGFFISKFGVCATEYAKWQSHAQILTLLPRFFVELTIIIIVFLGITYANWVGTDAVDKIPLLSVVAFSCYKMLPCFQQIYKGFAQLRFVGHVISSVANDCEVRDQSQYPTHQRESFEKRKGQTGLNLSKCIEVQNVSFSYQGQKKVLLSDVSMEINAGQWTGIIGPSGSGKTTLMDLLAGLHLPSAGHIKIDGIQLNKKNISAWQNLIGYVPPMTTIISGPVWKNVAFGVPDDDVDILAIEKALHDAGLAEFLGSRTKEGLNSLLVENGKNLSNGQRQRFGLARALYRKPKVLFLDEATSSLDISTEFSLYEAIKSINGVDTKLIITHREQPLQFCDTIFTVTAGKITRTK